MAESGRLPSTALRLIVRGVCAAGVVIAILVPAGLRAADSGTDTSADPPAAAAPGASETIEVPDSSGGPDASTAASAYDNPVVGAQSSTTQIPQAAPSESSPAPRTGDSWTGDPVVNYQRAQRGGYPYGPGIGSAEDFLIEGEDNVSPLGVKLRPDRRRLDSGEMASGLLVLAVTAGGPADKAGVKPYRHTARSTIEAVSVAGAFFFPPAMFLVPVLESSQIGDSYDLIIGVDGFRVTSALDFEDCMRDVQPGQIVYLSIVRNGSRVQLAVPVPSLVQ